MLTLDSKRLKVGEQAPVFSGLASDGTQVSLSDYLGSKVALYFYPKNHTPHCTTEACSIRDYWAEIKRAGIIVIGISADTPISHQKFIDHHDLPFTLISDQKKQIIDAYQAWRKGGPMLYGRVALIGVDRRTILIDESGVIVKIFMNPSIKFHGKEIYDAFAELDPNEGA